MICRWQMLSTYSRLSVFGFRQTNWSVSAAITTMPSTAKAKPRLPPSEHLPITCVTMAPANTPTIFMIPYAVALYFAEIIWQRIGMGSNGLQ